MTDTTGAELLDQVRKFLARFVAFPTEAALDAVTTWIAHAHLIDACANTPRLALLSPEPGSGKTRALEVLDLLVPEPMHALSASAPAVFRSIRASRPTLLFDEVDTIFGRAGNGDPSEDLRALLNAGHREGASIPRCVGPNHDVEQFPAYAAVALAGLGNLPETVMSRSVVIRMRKRAPDERVEAFRRRMHGPEGEALRDRLASWANSAATSVEEAWPEMPEGVADRAADVWEPLLAVADAAGGRWPAAARTACLALYRVATTQEASLGVRLLSDIRAIFGDDVSLSTAKLLARLNGIEEAPWADLRGHPLDPRRLAELLKPYEVEPKNVRFPTGQQLKGYQRVDFTDAFRRYLNPPP